MKHSSLRSALTTEQHSDYIDNQTAALLLCVPKSSRYLLWLVAVFFVFALLWANWASLDKVTVGQGRVIPSSQVQLIQNLEGGMVKAILVKEGQLVQKGQQLILLDDTRFRAEYREREQQLANLKASVFQLSAILQSIQINSELDEAHWQDSVILTARQIEFPAAIQSQHPTLVARYQAQYQQNLNQLDNQLSLFDEQIQQKYQDWVEIRQRSKHLQENYHTILQEFEITKPLAEEGVVPKIELLKLERQVNRIRQEMSSTQLKTPMVKAAIRESMLGKIDVAQRFRTQHQEQLNTTQNQLSAMLESTVALADKVKRTVVKSPMTGRVKALLVNTVGGVIQSGMNIVEIVPTEDNLLVEAYISPRDIAFVRPELPAVVKLSAYDFTRYGGLAGVVEHISADTHEDGQGRQAYIVRIRTHSKALEGTESLPIIPGMTATVDIITGKRTVLDYLTQPWSRMRYNALRED